MHSKPQLGRSIWLALSTLLVVVLPLAGLAGCIPPGPMPVGGDSHPPPEQPDPALAQGINDQLKVLPGVQSSEVTFSFDCIDNCKGYNTNYLAQVQLTDAVTAAEIVTVAATHLQAYTTAGIELFAIRLSLELGENSTLMVHDQELDLALAEGFLAVSEAADYADFQLPTDYSPFTADAYVDFAAPDLSSRIALAYAALSETTSTLPDLMRAVRVLFEPEVYFPIRVLPGTVYNPEWESIVVRLNEISDSLKEEKTTNGILTRYFPQDLDELRIDLFLYSSARLTAEEAAAIEEVAERIRQLGVKCIVTIS